MNVKLYIIVFFLLSITSCFNEKKQEKPIVEEPFSFPVLKCDKRLTNLLNFYDSTNPLHFMESNFPYFYIGNLKDTIQLDFFHIFEIAPPHPPNFSYENNFKDEDGLYQNNNTKQDYLIEFDEQIKYKFWDQKDIVLHVDTSITFSNNFPVYISNSHKDTIVISEQLGIRLMIEALDSSNKWRPIQVDYRFICGTGLGHIFLPPNECAITLVPIFKGNYKTKFRLRYGKNFSNPYDGFMNYKLFEKSDYNFD
ncbi:MAG: hypothetical protein Q8K70_09950 [Bacteroidota bacterium]|nr:hypothetical protein [Bacteroidota bacterium]